MKSWKKPTDEMVDRALKSIINVHTRKYFFSRLENPLWLQPLTERKRFKYPPKTQRFDDGTVIYPYWHELIYLKNVCHDLPDKVVALLLNLPESDNPVVYDGILDIALELPVEYSVKLKDKIFHFTSMERQFGTYRYANLLERWAKEGQTSTALELAKILIKFPPDPQSEEKHKQRQESVNDWGAAIGTLLHPVPKYSQISCPKAFVLLLKRNLIKLPASLLILQRI